MEVTDKGQNGQNVGTLLLRCLKCGSQMFTTGPVYTTEADKCSGQHEFRSVSLPSAGELKAMDDCEEQNRTVENEISKYKHQLEEIENTYQNCLDMVEESFRRLIQAAQDRRDELKNELQNMKNDKTEQVKKEKLAREEIRAQLISVHKQAETIIYTEDKSNRRTNKISQIIERQTRTYIRAKEISVFFNVDCGTDRFNKELESFGLVWDKRFPQMPKVEIKNISQDEIDNKLIVEWGIDESRHDSLREANNSHGQIYIDIEAELERDNKDLWCNRSKLSYKYLSLLSDNRGTVEIPLRNFKPFAVPSDVTIRVRSIVFNPKHKVYQRFEAEAPSDVNYPSAIVRGSNWSYQSTLCNPPPNKIETVPVVEDQKIESSGEQTPPPIEQIAPVQESIPVRVKYIDADGSKRKIKLKSNDKIDEFIEKYKNHKSYQGDPQQQFILVHFDENDNIIQSIDNDDDWSRYDQSHLIRAVGMPLYIQYRESSDEDTVYDVRLSLDDKPWTKSFRDALNDTLGLSADDGVLIEVCDEENGDSIKKIESDDDFLIYKANIHIMRVTVKRVVQIPTEVVCFYSTRDIETNVKWKKKVKNSDGEQSWVTAMKDAIQKKQRSGRMKQTDSIQLMIVDSENYEYISPINEDADFVKYQEKKHLIINVAE